MIHHSTGEKYWALSDDGGSLGTNACFGWPVAETTVRGSSYYCLRADISHHQVKVLIVDSLDDWQAQHVRWLAPVSHIKQTGRCQLFCIPDGEPYTVLRASAKRAFHGLGRQVLYSLGRKIGAEVNWEMRLFELVMALVSFCLPGIPDEEMFRILSLRCPAETVWGEWLKTEDAKDLLASSKDDDCNEVAEGLQKKADIEHDYKASFVQYRKKVQEKREAATPAKGRGRGRGAKGAASRPALRLPTHPPAVVDTTTEREIQASLPPGFRVYRDSFNCRWQLSQGPSRVVSRSWGCHGYVGSALDIVRAAWERHYEQGGEKPSWLDTRPPAAGPSAPSGSGAASSAGAK